MLATTRKLRQEERERKSKSQNSKGRQTEGGPSSSSRWEGEAETARREGRREGKKKRTLGSLCPAGSLSGCFRGDMWAA